MWQWDSLSIKAAGCWIVAIAGKLVLAITGSTARLAGVSLDGFFNLMGGAAIILTAIWLIRWIIRRYARSI